MLVEIVFLRAHICGDHDLLLGDRRLRVVGLNEALGAFHDAGVGIGEVGPPRFLADSVLGRLGRSADRTLPGLRLVIGNAFLFSLVVGPVAGFLLLDDGFGLPEAGFSTVRVAELVGQLVAAAVLAEAESSSSSTLCASARIFATSVSMSVRVRLAVSAASALTLWPSSATTPTLTSPASTQSRSPWVNRAASASWLPLRNRATVAWSGVSFAAMNLKAMSSVQCRSI